MRIAIYARVSTGDKGQDPENQLRELRAWYANNGHDIVREYVGHVSGRKGIGLRKQFAALFEDASKRKFDCVLFWALDRFSREGMVPTIHHLERLSSYGVTFHSYTEPHLCADNEMVRGILRVLTHGEQEAKRLSERVIAGLARARAKGTRSGKPIGRPRVDDKTERAIQASLKAGIGINKTAAGVGVGVATVQRIKAKMLTPAC
jgi:DNA invertase Pin-like site-specific DNA recombinase